MGCGDRLHGFDAVFLDKGDIRAPGNLFGNRGVHRCGESGDGPVEVGDILELAVLTGERTDLSLSANAHCGPAHHNDVSARDGVVDRDHARQLLVFDGAVEWDQPRAVAGDGCERNRDEYKDPPIESIIVQTLTDNIGPVRRFCTFDLGN